MKRAFFARQTVDDASDWPHAAHQGLERALRCPICSELLRAAVVLRPCGHAFCSACVRRALRTKLACPSCTAHACTGDIVPCRALQDAVFFFARVRDQWIAFARAHDAPAISSDALSQTGAIEVDPGAKETGQDNTKTEAQTAEPSTKRLKEPVYNLMPDAEIRRALAALGLPTAGARELLIRRHAEYVLLQNAALDGREHVGAAALRAQLAEAERLWAAAGAPQRKPDGAVVDAHFQSLIAAAKRPRPDAP